LAADPRCAHRLGPIRGPRVGGWPRDELAHRSPRARGGFHRRDLFRPAAPGGRPAGRSRAGAAL